MVNMERAIEYLDLAHEYAETMSGCAKVHVGSVIPVKDAIVFGANRTLPVSCREEGCLRVKLYGEDSKNHRLPSDCRSIHSEIDAISNVANSYHCTFGCTIYVTRYPCEACARAIVSAGIVCVVYGRKERISEMTKEIFKSGGVKVIHINEWNREDNNS